MHSSNMLIGGEDHLMKLSLIFDIEPNNSEFKIENTINND